MNQYMKFIMAAVLLITAASCKRDEVFEREQYKNVFAIVSGTDNVYRVVHDYRFPLSTGYISASLGGSKVCDQDIKITMVEDDNILLNYNKKLYQDDRDRYVKALKTNKYSFEKGLSMTIKSGDTKASIPVKVEAAGLSPDSIRYIALRVETYNAGELNMKKSTILYQVCVRNWWCDFSGTQFVSRGQRFEGNIDPTSIFTNKNLYPLSATKVRVMPGSELELDQLKNPRYKAFAMTMNISDDELPFKIDGVEKMCSPVTIEPYGTLDIQQINKGDPDYDANYPNIAISEDYDGFYFYKTFLLNYRFTDSNGKSARIKEELRLKYIKDPKDPRFKSSE